MGGVGTAAALSAAGRQAGKAQARPRAVLNGVVASESASSLLQIRALRFEASELLLGALFEVGWFFEDMLAGNSTLV